MKHRRTKHRAVALTYRGDTPAPFVVAKGRGDVALRVKNLASRYGIPIVSDSQLADRLYVLDVGETIPEELYRVVAELFAFVYRVTEKRKSE